MSEAEISQIFHVPNTMVDSQILVKDMLDALSTSQGKVPSLAVDLEGLNLGNSDGSIYLMQIYDSESRHLYSVDIYTLGQAVFSIPASDGVKILAKTLECAEVLKKFCDVRADSHALFKEFGVRLQGVKDVQNLQLASRDHPRAREFRPGLDRVIRSWIPLDERTNVSDYKAKGRNLCNRFGYELFSVRPLRRDLMIYAGNDVLFLQRIYSGQIKYMSEERLESADAETNKWLLKTQDPEYSPAETRKEKAMVRWPVCV